MLIAQPVVLHVIAGMPAYYMALLQLKTVAQRPIMILPTRCLPVPCNRFSLLARDRDASETGGRLGGRTSITNGIFGKASLSRASAALADLFHHHHIKPQSSGSATAQGAREPSTAAERAGSAEQEPSPKDAIGRGGGGGSGVVGAGDRTNTGGSAGGAGGDRRERQGSGGGAGAERAEAGAGPSSVPREGGGARLMAVLNHLRANAAAGGSAGAAAPLGTRTARQQGIKVRMHVLHSAHRWCPVKQSLLCAPRIRCKAALC